MTEPATYPVGGVPVNRTLAFLGVIPTVRRCPLTFTRFGKFAGPAGAALVAVPTAKAIVLAFTRMGAMLDPTLN